MEEKERYLFLDIDGVLNTMSYAMVAQWRYGSDTDEDGALFDPYAVENLQYIIDSIPVRIVISSTWRLNGLNWMRWLWEKRCLPGEIYGIVPVLENVHFANLEDGTNTSSVIPYGTRGLEINEWLRINPRGSGVSYEYAIIDDCDDFLTIQSDHIVYTEPETGLTKLIADKVLEILA